MKMPCDFRMYGPAYCEYFVLRDMKPVGPEIGRLGDVALHDVLEDKWGRSYRYVGVCPAVRRAWGDQLNKGEFILPPGVVYRMLDGAEKACSYRSSFLKRLFAFAGLQRATESLAQSEAKPTLNWRTPRDVGEASRGDANLSIGRVRLSKKK
jgi:hypothetical protein